MPRRKDRPRLKYKYKIKSEKDNDGNPTFENGVQRISSASIETPEEETKEEVVFVIDLCSSQEAREVKQESEPQEALELKEESKHSDCSSPPELIKGNLNYVSPERVKQKSDSNTNIDDIDDCPLSKIKRNLRRKLKKDKNEPVSSGTRNNRESLTKTTINKERPIVAPAIPPPTNGTHIPKFNIVHADKSKKFAQPSMNLRSIKRTRSPSPLKYALVLQNGDNQKPRGTRGRPRKTPAKPIKQDSNTQTSDGKIKRVKDLCCDGCEKNLILVPSSQEAIENVILKRSLDNFMQLTQPTRKAINNKCKEIVQQVQTCNVFKTRMCAPTHKVPTIGLISKPSIEMPTLERISDVGSDTTLDSNTKQVDMDVESSPDTQLPKLTFIQQQPSHPFHASNYDPQDFLKIKCPMPSLIPQGAFMSKTIVKRDDIARIGQFMELYDNPKRPKLLEVEHPPEENDGKSLINSNIAFFGELEPETPAIDPESELLRVFNDISDDDHEDDAAKFSSDDEGANMSDTCSVAAIDNLDDDFDLDAILNDYERSEPQESEDSPDTVIGDQDFCGTDVAEVQEIPIPTPEEPAHVSPKKSLEAEMMKNFNKTPLEMIDDELDFDYDDIESPAYEDIITNQSMEDLLLDSSSSQEIDITLTDESEDEAEIQIMDEPDPLADQESQEETTAEQCQNVEPEQLDDEPDSDITMEMPVPAPGTLSTKNSDVLSEKPSVSCSLDASAPPVLSLKTPMSEATLKTCTNTILTEFYEYCTEDRQRFVVYFPMIAKEMGDRQMTCDIMKALRACENLQVISYYKLIVEALILAGMQKKMAVKYLCDNHLASTKEATDLLIDIILEHDCADDVMEYLEGIAKHYSFNSSSLERLLPQAIKTGRNIRWKNLVSDIIANMTSRRILYKNIELTKQTMAWLQDKEENKTDIGISEAKKRETSVWSKTIIIRNQDFKVPKAMPQLIPILKRK